MIPEKAVPAILDKINKLMPVPQIGSNYLGGLQQKPRETEHSVAGFVFCSYSVSRPVTKEEMET